MKGIGNAITKVGEIKTVRGADISWCKESQWLEVVSIPDVEDTYLKRDGDGKPVAMNDSERAIKDTEITAEANVVQLSKVRAKRNAMLKSIDEVPCTVDRWEAFTQAQKDAWITRKQYLRDATNQADIFNIDWGVDPE